jgi:hypothetical protein
MKQLNLSYTFAVWFDKKNPESVGIGVGYDCEDLTKKDVTKLITWLTKALEKMK